MHRLVVTNQEGATRAIARGLERALQNNMRVLWLMSGGGNIAVELDALSKLQHATPDNLVVSLIDERFVPADSTDSNWQQLLDGGLTEQHCRWVPVVLDPALDLQAAAANFEERLSAALQNVDVIIGQFGIGSDGHTAGILPHSAPLTEQQRMVVAYDAPDFKRITITPAFFPRIDLAVVVAMNPEKRQVLQQLATSVPAESQPAQLLKNTKELIIYTDQEVGWQ